MSEEKPDARKHPRSEILLKVEYPGYEDFLHDYTENISKGGTFVYSERQWQVGDRLRLTLSFPGLLRPIQLHGEVAWVRTDQDRGIGVRFLFEENPESERRLAELVRAIEKGDAGTLARRIRILVVEDNQFIQKLLRDGLDSIARRRLADAVTLIFREAANGFEGLECVMREPIDLLICDLYLPVLDGFELIRRTRLTYPKGSLPILAFSAGGADAGRRALALGADIFLDKPLRLTKVFETILDLLHLGEAMSSPDEPPTESPGAGRSAPSDSSVS
jgi:uncharacterized protein (TIGR02266 family)